MRTQVEFRSDKFPPYDGEEEQINPGLWGRRLTEYLSGKLEAKGIKTGSMAVEDWGCYLPIHLGDGRLALCCGHQDGDNDEFLVFTDPGSPITTRWFKKIDRTSEFTKLLDTLTDILESDPEIKDIVWHDPS